MTSQIICTHNVSETKHAVPPRPPIPGTFLCWGCGCQKQRPYVAPFGRLLWCNTCNVDALRFPRLLWLQGLSGATGTPLFLVKRLCERRNAPLPKSRQTFLHAVEMLLESGESAPFRTKPGPPA